MTYFINSEPKSLILCKSLSLFIKSDRKRFAAAAVISLMIHSVFFALCWHIKPEAQTEPVMNVRLVFKEKPKPYIRQKPIEEKKIEIKKEIQKKTPKPIEKAEPAKPKAVPALQKAITPVAPAAENEMAISQNEDTGGELPMTSGSVNGSDNGTPESAGNGADNGIAEINSLIVTHKKSPEYPMFSRKRREEGTSVIIATVENGRVTRVELEKSSGFDRLDASALTAAKEWRFDHSEKIMVRIPFAFKMK